MPQPRLVNPTLELIRGSRPAETFEISGADFHIGRKPSLDLFIDDIRVSRLNTRIQRRHDGSYDLVDLDSQNGTHLGGKKLKPYRPVRLRDGDRIKIVKYELVFHQPAAVLDESQDDNTKVLGSLDDLGSEGVLKRSSHSAGVLRAILEVIRALGGGNDLSDMLGGTLAGLMGVFPKAERGFIVMADPDGSFPLAAVRFRPGHASTPTVSRTIRDRVLREGKGLLIEDVSFDQELSGRKSIASTVRSAICVPLLSHEERQIGMVQLDRLAGKENFHEQDLDLLAALALPIGVVIENDRLLKERATWAAAREIQRALLPRVHPEVPGYSFWECYRPVQEVGGDLYDYIAVNHGSDQSPRSTRWAVTLGDVAGKGMPAALVMAGICPEIRHLVRTGVPPEEVLGQVNRHVYDHGVEGRFVTLVLTVLDPLAHELTIATAGHPHAHIRRDSGVVEEIVCEGDGPPLGSIREAVYLPTRVQLDPGDVVVLFSDGVTDARARDGEFFGMERLRMELTEAPAGVEAVGESILGAVRDHFSGRSQFDDITIVCFGRERA
jgi:serine phosphatase RsbU (regulator of sigma subunit)/pSer/pThr/pTyr-binding forkhead associated (FHA) protein